MTDAQQLAAKLNIPIERARAAIARAVTSPQAAQLRQAIEAANDQHAKN